MREPGIDRVLATLLRLKFRFRLGKVEQIQPDRLRVTGLADVAALGDVVEIQITPDEVLKGDVEQVADNLVYVVPRGSLNGVKLGMYVRLLGQEHFSPDECWAGRVIDPYGEPLDDFPLFHGVAPMKLQQDAPRATDRRGFGGRLETGNAAFNTFLPIARGQRIGLFAGSGVGKSTLLAQLAKSIEADVVVIALIGERGREVNEFVKNALGEAGLDRAVVVAATADRPASTRKRCAHSAMCIAETFRDKGQHVLLIMDSVTRFAEAHRDLALGRGEPSAIEGFPTSTTQEIMNLAERAGPGGGTSGDITAIFSVLVPGSNMEGLVADTLRGVLDGHVILDRSIAERGRFPAINIRRSVSRSLPEAASEAENALLADGRRLLSLHHDAELLIKTGLYEQGNDLQTDRAVQLWPELDAFIGSTGTDTEQDFARLRSVLEGASKAALPTN